jgi:hypothetical protein
MTDKLALLLDEHSATGPAQFQVQGEKGVYLVQARLLQPKEIDVITKNWFGKDPQTCPRCNGLGTI